QVPAHQRGPAPNEPLAAAAPTPVRGARARLTARSFEHPIDLGGIAPAFGPVAEPGEIPTIAADHLRQRPAGVDPGVQDRAVGLAGRRARCAAPGLAVTPIRSSLGASDAGRATRTGAFACP